MGESEIPPFLLTDIHTEDRTKLLNDLQLSVLWLYTNGDKPFDREAAIRLQSRLRAQYEAKMRERTEKRRKEREHTQKAYLELATAIAEIVFRIEARGEDIKNEKVEWHTPIVDAATNKRYGSPHELFNGIGDCAVNLGWDSVNTDARVDLAAYLDALKAKYDNFEYEFHFFRDRSPFSDVGPIFRFRLKLTYQPFNTNEVARKVRKNLDKARAKM